MNTLKIHLIIFASFMFLNVPLNGSSQTFTAGIDCGMEDMEKPKESASPYEFGGAFKPEKTHTYPLTNSESVFKILIVFVQFQNDTIDPGNPNWPAGQEPIYMNNLLSAEKSTSGGSNWWNHYSETNQIISDYWIELSRGNFHVTGKSYHIQLDHPWYWYAANDGAKRINSEIYDKLDSVQDIQWSSYDNWTYEDGTYKYKKDGKIDMMYVVQRTYRDGLGWNPGSIASLFHSLQGEKHVVSSGDTIVAGFEFFGSGCHYTPGKGCGGPCAPMSLHSFLIVQAHELGHYFYGYGVGSVHANYGIMASGARPFGGEPRMSPWETIKLGWVSPITVNYNFVNHSIGDFSSRHSGIQGQILQVPISGEDEFFLMTLRNKVSSWDRVMIGDTAHGDPFRNINPEYGKGVYIYHNNSGYTFSPHIDMECADGLYNWISDGIFYPDWVIPAQGAQTLPIFKWTSVSFNNDKSTGSPNNADEKSVLIQSDLKWGSIGKPHTVLYGDGTDRVFTNEISTWTSRALQGDRWDAWRVGYNEMFSPYSSPSTKSWDDQETGIFMWFHEEVNDVAHFKIYRASEYGGTMSLANILIETPPSRPMGLRVDPEGPMIDGYYRFKLTWLHNMELDMERGSHIDPRKRYKIYRSVANNMTQIPPDAHQYSENYYTLIATVDLNSNVTPEFIDTELISEANSPPDGQCPPTCWTMYPVRYRVQAVDKYEDHSVLSDFDQGRAWRIETGGGGKDPGVEQMPHPGEGLAGETPSEFALIQNYPNPFNPITNIQFDLPRDEFVTIKIYDMTGREIEVLLNDFRNAGRYLVSFNASHLASGVYFYTIQAGSFEQTKRMILLK